MPVIPAIGAGISFLGTTAGATLGAAALGTGASLLASGKASGAAKDAAAIQQAGTDKALALQTRQYDESVARQQPWLDFGMQALQKLGQVHGFTVSGAPGAPVASSGAAHSDTPDYGAYVDNNPDLANAFASQAGVARGKTKEQFGAEHWAQSGQNEQGRPWTPFGSTAAQAPVAQAQAAPAAPGAAPAYGGFTESPDYQYRRDQSLRGVTSNAAARGLLDSGALGAGLIKVAGNEASGEFDKWYSRLATAAGIGKSAADSIGSAGASFASNSGNLITSGANVQSQALQQQGANSAGLIGDLGGIGVGLLQNYAKPPSLAPAASGASLQDTFSQLAAKQAAFVPPSMSRAF